MTTAETFSALSFLAFGLVMLGIGVWLAIRFMAAAHGQNDHVQRFYRDVDINDAADQATDEDTNGHPLAW